VVTTGEVGDKIVTVLPITHAPPSDESLAVEIPVPTKRRLGLDDEQSWVVLTEANRFTWPGPDLRPTAPGKATEVAYGLLPRALFREIKTKLATAIEARAVRVVPRSE
jgi:hypothetical protein